MPFELMYLSAVEYILYNSLYIECYLYSLNNYGVKYLLNISQFMLYSIYFVVKKYV